MNEYQKSIAGMSAQELGEKEYMRICLLTAQVKRLVELVTLLPGARDQLRDDPEGLFKEWNLDLDAYEMQFMILPEYNNERLRLLKSENVLDEISESFFRYRQFMANKMAARDMLIKKGDVPNNNRVKKWRERQIGRCQGALGGVNDSFVHAMVTYELADGCSVGCKFCGLDAGMLKSLFRYTPENAKLFQDVLKVCHEILGDAAGGGMMYFASEPLDNPDYEKFEQDYLKEFNIIPQITTAVPDRDIERTRYFVHELYGGHGFIHRFSLRSLETAKKILKSFSPEELLLVELLPQYPEAPSFVPYTVVGKQIENVKNDVPDKGAFEGKKALSRLTLDEMGLSEDGIPIVSLDSLKDKITDPGTICCIDGFRINFARKEVTIFTPCHMSSEHPKGISEAATLNFTDGEDFREKMLKLIDEYMITDLPDNEPLKIYDYFRLAYDGKLGTVLVSLNGGETLLLDKLPAPYSIPLIKELMKGKYTKQELVRIIMQRENVEPEKLFYLLTQLWKKGFIVDSKFFTR